MITSRQMQDAIFDKLVDLRQEVKELLQDVPVVEARENLDRVYANNIAVYSCIGKIDKYIREVM